MSVETIDNIPTDPQERKRWFRNERHERIVEALEKMADNVGRLADAAELANSIEEEANYWTGQSR